MQAPKKYTNKLITETSPYLLQHAHNPVYWYPWGEEAFARAKAEDKPVLVSIGYSACHWCHVMEHESFEDEKVAAVMNEHFVSIKVDMEERPDVDKIYMNFVQITTGRGGWPMNVFITPEKLPFFGGTYFPPSPRYGMPSWTQILLSIAEAWRERRDELTRSATEILGELRRLGVNELSPAIDRDMLNFAYSTFAKSFDAKNGGWGGAPKFPQAMSMEFLLRYWKRTGDQGALEMVRKTAEKMANGGIYDQLGGGFHRYAVDAVWLVPHFEKMLYDNAQLIRAYLHLYQATKDEFFRTVAADTLEYVRREMLDPSGGFYSSQDADSEGEEGKFFVWTPAEIIDVLGEEEGRIFNTYYDVTADGNFEGRNIPNVEFGVGLPEFDKRNKPSELSVTEAAIGGHARFADSRKKLFEAREKRIKPFRDEKVLTAWNGLMLAAFAEAAAILGDDKYLEIARRNADFLLANMIERQAVEGTAHTTRLLRTWKDGKAKLNGYIEDYANLADGLIELYQVSGQVRYLTEARALAETMLSEFWDAEDGGFYFTSTDHEVLIVRNKDFFDNATPSGNSVATDVLFKLAKFYGEERFEMHANTALRAAANQIRRYPQGFGRALSAAEFGLSAVQEVVIVGERGNDLERAVWSEFRPFKVVAIASALADYIEPPLIEGREMIDEKPTAYVCENFVCQLPVTKAKEMAELLDA